MKGGRLQLGTLYIEGKKSIFFHLSITIILSLIFLAFECFFLTFLIAPLFCLLLLEITPAVLTKRRIVRTPFRILEDPELNYGLKFFRGFPHFPHERDQILPQDRPRPPLPHFPILCLLIITICRYKMSATERMGNRLNVTGNCVCHTP